MAALFGETKRTKTTDLIKEWQRQRRTAYPSGRKEQIGYEKPDLGRIKRKMKRNTSIMTRMPSKGRFRFRIY